MISVYIYFLLHEILICLKYDRMYSSAPGQLLVQTRVFGLETVSAMRQLEPSDIEKLVAVKVYYEIMFY
jgi:hypothetical protein